MVLWYDKPRGESPCGFLEPVRWATLDAGEVGAVADRTAAAGDALEGVVDGVRRGCQRAHRRECGGVADDGASVAVPVRRRGSGQTRAGTQGAWAEAVDYPGAGGADRARHAARKAKRRNALEHRVDGPPRRGEPVHGAADLARPGAETASGGHVQGLDRPGVRGQAHRRGRLVSEPAGERDRAVHGREVAGAGAGAITAVPAEEARPSR